MKKVHLWGIHPCSFEEGSDNFYAVCMYDVAVCRLAAILQLIGDDRLRFLRKETKEFFIQMHSDFDVKSLESRIEKYSNIGSVVSYCAFMSRFKGNENIMSNVKDACTTTDFHKFVESAKYKLEFYPVV